MLCTIPPANSDLGDHQRDHHRRRLPARRPPRCRRSPGRPSTSRQQILDASGFTKTAAGPGRQHRAAGQVLGTDPPAGQTVPQDTVIQIQVSRGNQFVMPDLTGQFWIDAEPNLRALGWTGVLHQGRQRRTTAGSAPTGGHAEPAGGHRRQLRRDDHAELRVVARAASPRRRHPRSRAGPCRRLPARGGAPAPRRARRRSSPASWPASGARPRSGSTRGGTARRGSAARRAGRP